MREPCREARLIIPVGALAPGKQVKLFQESLCAMFGGYTRTLGRGGWKDSWGEVKHEVVEIYDIAVTDDQFRILQTVAAWVAFVGNQEQVYVRAPDGVIRSVPAGGYNALEHNLPWMMLSPHLRQRFQDMDAQQELLMPDSGTGVEA